MHTCPSSTATEAEFPLVLMPSDWLAGNTNVIEGFVDVKTIGPTTGRGSAGWRGDNGKWLGQSDYKLYAQTRAARAETRIARSAQPCLVARARSKDEAGVGVVLAFVSVPQAPMAYSHSIISAWRKATYIGHGSISNGAVPIFR